MAVEAGIENLGRLERLDADVEVGSGVQLTRSVNGQKHVMQGFVHEVSEFLHSKQIPVQGEQKTSYVNTKVTKIHVAEVMIRSLIEGVPSYEPHPDQIFFKEDGHYKIDPLPEVQPYIQLP
jgi:hypothetical protein